MARRVPRNFLVVAAVVAAVVVGSLMGVLRHRSDVPGGPPPLAGTVAHFSLSNPRLPAPAVAFRDRDGADVPLSSFRGRVVLLNFWATWCLPCLKEMPSLDRLQGAFGGPDFTVVPVSIDRDGRAVAEPYFERLGIKNLALYLDPESRTVFSFGVHDLPVSVLLGRNGRVVGRMAGPAEWDSPEAEALVRYLIAEKG